MVVEPDTEILGTEARQVLDLPVMCPAGAPVGENLEGSGVHCRITRSNLNTATDPTSLRTMCCAAGDGAEGGYQHCPAWRFDKKRGWESKTTQQVAAERRRERRREEAEGRGMTFTESPEHRALDRAFG